MRRISQEHQKVVDQALQQKETKVVSLDSKTTQDILDRKRPDFTRQVLTQTRSF